MLAAVHRGLGDIYLADPRFTATYQKIRPGHGPRPVGSAPGHANADRLERGRE
ncbi:MAG: TipAS antibiotic-recognition domain-containing protein [Dermatophilaceae bacterium]